MKVDSGLFYLALAGFCALAAAQPHGIKHRHVARNNVHVVTEYTTQFVTITGPSPTASIPAVSSSILSPAPSSTPDLSIESNDDDHENNSSPVSSIVSTVTSTTTPSASSTPSSDSSSDLSIDPASGKGVDTSSTTSRDFPDGTLDCDTFPSDYGAICMNWVTEEGWSGIQVGNTNADAIGKCTEGALCSYACPAGYSKSQWPSDQPSDGESRGGLLCQGGKLHLTRPSVTKLCQPGASGVTVQNKLSQVVSVCRTDYPGSENMVIPLSCDAGSTKPLTVPIATDSYLWQGKFTSAQYYVNPAGTDVKDGCKWGQAGQNFGNWAPIIFGAGQTDGTMWVSMSQNQLNDAPFGSNIEITGASSECYYKNGKFYPTDGGCTTSAPSGSSIAYVITPSDG